MKLKLCLLIYFLLVIEIVDASRKLFRRRRNKGGKSEFTCKDGQNILRQQFCNGKNDCSDHSDEIVQGINNTKLVVTPFSTNPIISCKNAQNAVKRFCSLSRSDYCDGTIVCSSVNECDVLCPNYYRCPGTSICKDRSLICSGEDCYECPGKSVWNNGIGFKCVRDGEMCGLPQFLVFDGVQDCDDGSDLCYLTYHPDSTLLNDPRDIREMKGAKFNKTVCFVCLDKSLVISRKHVCNGIIDCPDLSDECLCEGEKISACRQMVTTKTAAPINVVGLENCSYGNIKCPNGECIQRSQVCDGVIDCFDEFDESYSFCHGTKSCNKTVTPGHFCRCDKNNSYADCNNVIAIYCNGVPECPPPGYQSRWVVQPGRPIDECNPQCILAKTTTIAPTTTQALLNTSQTHFHKAFKCAASDQVVTKKDRFLKLKCYIKVKRKLQLIQLNASQYCDGVLNCPFSVRNDEMVKECTRRFSCASGNLVSIPKSRVCDGYLDCNNERDEKTRLCRNFHRYNCSALGGAKVSISENQICDFVINCDDMSDEKNCTNDDRFYCENQKPLFIERRKVFNGLKDCSDWSDECPTIRNDNQETVLSSRYELIANPVLRVLVWIMGLLAVFGNLLVLIRQVLNLNQINNSAALRANHLLVLNLAVSDILMGIYLFMLGAYGLKYSGNYCSHDLTWRSGEVCNIMGVLVVLSSETSVITMVILTSFRLYVIYKPFKASHHPKLIIVLLLIFLTWITTSLIAVLPLTTKFQSSFTTTALVTDLPFFKSIKVDFLETKTYVENLPFFEPKYQNWTADHITTYQTKISDITSWHQFANIFQKKHIQESMTRFKVIRYFGYYSVNSVCIPKLYVTTADRAWRYSFSINLFNFVAFIFVAISYTIVYAKSSSNEIRSESKRTLSKSKSKTSFGRFMQKKKSQAMQRKILRLIMTDFCCWVPISVMAFLNLGGVQLPGVAYAVSAIILLPINSALNPIIYSNAMERFYKFIICKRKNQSFITSSTIASSSR